MLGTVAHEYGTTPELVSDQVSLYLQQNDVKSAEKALVAAVKEHPSVPEYYGLLSQFYDGNGKSKKAIKLLEKAVERFPLIGHCTWNWRISQRYGKTAQAMYHMEQGLVLDGVPLEDLMPVALNLPEQGESGIWVLFDVFSQCWKEIRGHLAVYLVPSGNLSSRKRYERRWSNMWQP